MLLAPAGVTGAEPKLQLNDSFCAAGTRAQLNGFFQDEGLIVFADGIRNSKKSPPSEHPDVLFLIDRATDRFFLIKLVPEADGQYEACVFISAREVDYMMNSPVAGLIEPVRREHILFFQEIPKDTVCPATNSSCIEWSQWSHLLRNTKLLTAYIYSNKWEHDVYNATVTFTLEGKVIETTRGKLAQFARQKYALRMRGEIQESEAEHEAALELYKRVHDEVDHQHPVLILWLTDNNKWAVSAVDRIKGLVWTPIKGSEFRLYPEDRVYYQQFLEKENPQP